MGLSRVIYSILFPLQGIRAGKKVRMSGFPIIAKDKSAKISIGDNCHIRSAFLSNLVGMYQRAVIVARGDAEISVGNDVGISGATIYAREGIEIGDKCIIGGNVKILDNDFHPTNPTVREETPCDNFGVKRIKIGRNVFIGCNVIILKGVEIGEGAVIGAGSVVSSDVPAYCLAVGNPAKVVKQLK